MGKKLTEEEKAIRAEIRAAYVPPIYQITPDFRIVGGNEFTPEEKKVSESGVSRWETMGHCSELGNAIYYIAKRGVAREHLNEILFVASQLENIEKVCMEINKNMNHGTK
jgi:hypothetical protein